MYYSHHIDACFDDEVEHGLSKKDFKDGLETCAPVLDALKKQKKDNTIPLLTIAEKEDDLDDIRALATHIRDNFKNLVVLGTGGSTLTGQTLVGLKQHHTFCDHTAPRVLFLDSIDPDTVRRLFTSIALKDTCFLIISKSGETLETLAQAMLCFQHIDDTLGRDFIRKHCFTITCATRNILRTLSHDLEITTLEHAPDIGGRFSIFTSVGLLPAAVAGLDIAAIRKGAADTVKKSLGNPENSEPAKGAVLHTLLMRQSIHQAVLMPYVDRLTGLAVWHRQIWAESLGKNHKGSTPSTATGTLDQHSQLQLYLDGPKDKFFTLIGLDGQDDTLKIDERFTENQEKLSYVGGKSLGNIVNAEHRATLDMLAQAGLPVRNFQLPELDEATLGALSMQCILETLITAELLGINAFDQPAVEQGKVRARELLEAMSS